MTTSRRDKKTDVPSLGSAPRRRRGTRILIAVAAGSWWSSRASSRASPSLTGLTKADGGHVVVVRNGGPFDDNSIRQVIQPNSGLTSTGLFSAEHPYPSTQRNFKVSGAKNADSNEVINVPTKDGVLVGVEGTFYFDVNFTDEKVMRAFDDKYGTRTYPVAGGSATYAWDGDDGLERVPLVHPGQPRAERAAPGDRQRRVRRPRRLLLAGGQLQRPGGRGQPERANGNETINQVQQAVNDGFTKDVDDVLGVPILIHPRFVLSKVDLPANVQDAINKAQAAFAGVTESQAALQRAQIDAQANAARQSGYNSCPTCAQIDILKSLPPGLTTYAPGSGFAVTGSAPTDSRASVEKRATARG